MQGGQRVHPWGWGVFVAIAAMAWVDRVPISAEDSGAQAGGGDGAFVVGLVGPCRRSVLGVAITGRIDRTPVKEGQFVAAGELIIGLNDAVQAAREAAALADAESTLALEIARTQWEHADHNLQRLLTLQGGEHAASKEVSDARFEVLAKKLEHETAAFNLQQAYRVWQRERAILDQYEIRAPFDGLIAKLERHLGESAEPGLAIATIVAMDPLELSLDCPMGIARDTREGYLVDVEPVDPTWPAATGVISHVGRVADAASQTIKVKLLIANTGGAWISGLKVKAMFPARPAAEARAGGRSDWAPASETGGLKSPENQRRAETPNRGRP